MVYKRAYTRKKRRNLSSTAKNPRHPWGPCPAPYSLSHASISRSDVGSTDGRMVRIAAVKSARRSARTDPARATASRGPSSRSGVSAASERGA